MPSSIEPPLKILVVDDDELDRLAVRRCLQQSGMHVQCDEVSSASEALERADIGYDCIFLDYYLPGEDSLETLRRLHEAIPQTPVVIFTGRGDEDIAVELMKGGAADYLPKVSLTPERIGSAIRYAQQVSQSAAARRRAEKLLKLLSEAARHLLTATDAEELVSGLWESFKEPLGIDAYLNIVFDSCSGSARLASFGGISEETANEVAASVSAPTAHAMARESVHLIHMQDGNEAFALPLRAAGVRACAFQPLLADGRRFGLLCFASRRKDRFTPDEVEFLGTVSHYATSAYERLRHIQEMQESDRRKDEFLATLAHELRDPLAPLSNVLELMKHSSEDSDVLRQVRATMERQLGHLVQLVDDLLDMNRITRSKLSLRRRRVDLASVVHQAVEMARPLTEAAAQELEVSLPDHQIWLNADPVRLAQVFGNLLSNSSKFSEREGCILLSAVQQDDQVIVTVRDTGIGIPPGEIRAIFEMFAQVSSARERAQGGLGIGLTLVSRLVAMHDGSVEARSEGPGKGSEFIVCLPVLTGTQRDMTPEGQEKPETNQERRILVVDDNQDTAASLAMLLQMSGNTTCEAHDGLAAMKTAAEFRPDIVLLDIGLPHLDGYEVCRRLRDKPWGRDVMIVALSGWGQDKDRRRSREAGFDHHLVKPVHYAALVKLFGDQKSSPAQSEMAG